MRAFLAGLVVAAVLAAGTAVAYDRLAVGSETGFAARPQVHPARHGR